ncbi:hypothetical protein LSAT2_005021 [Lamellibrachia satsuma]|nr:hypothetical protein LSAT2_005021 [Lamellibrachia satsuma]
MTLIKCSVTCGDNGTMTKQRRCDRPAPQKDGLPCPGGDVNNPSVSTGEFICNRINCPVHGQWSTWYNYTDCSVTCGPGTKRRNRTCDNPAPTDGGINCYGKDTEVSTCTRPPCAVPGNWGEWGTPGMCNVTCGGGVHTRMRQCNNPAPKYGGASCLGSNEESLPCGTTECPTIDGAWTRWSSWGPCTVDCGGGRRTRLRTCTNPKSKGGAPCDGMSTRAETCNEQNCPLGHVERVDGQWTQWTEWSECPVTCGGASVNRERTCSNPAPSGGGRPCTGRDVDAGHLTTRETQGMQCALDVCPIDGQWSTWTTWSTCSVSCATNGGVRTRTRACNNPAPRNGGQSCVGASTFTTTQRQNTVCNKIDCKDITTTKPTTTTTTVSTTTTGPVMCPSTEAWDKIFWPTTLGGATSSINCSLPTLGLTYRKCSPEGEWLDVDTFMCYSPAFTHLERQVQQWTVNVSVRQQVLSELEQRCTTAHIATAGDLRSCDYVIRSLIEMDFLADSVESVSKKEQSLLIVIDAISNVLSKENRQQWLPTITKEERSNVSMLAEITRNLENLGHQIARYLRRLGRESYCVTNTNVGTYYALSRRT